MTLTLEPAVLISKKIKRDAGIIPGAARFLCRTGIPACLSFIGGNDRQECLSYS
jgi:hypothetical protein